MGHGLQAGVRRLHPAVQQHAAAGAAGVACSDCKVFEVAAANLGGHQGARFHSSSHGIFALLLCGTDGEQWRGETGRGKGTGASGDITSVG